MMKFSVFCATLTVELTLGVSFILTFFVPNFSVWPPPSRRSWQFWFIWILVDLAYIGFIVVGIVDWNSFFLTHWLRFPLGTLLILLGLSLAIWGMSSLSYHTSLGLEGDFITSGPYRFTRNPQYVGFIIAIVGDAILTNSWMTWVAGFLGALLFAVTPFLEEPWLTKKFGPVYEEYRRRVPRYFGFPKHSNGV
jgi:protein-S-isoprenylcysteine O-methyltransferase Ste14